jgi:hypothetical protein
MEPAIEQPDSFLMGVCKVSFGIDPAGDYLLQQLPLLPRLQCIPEFGAGRSSARSSAAHPRQSL